MSAILYYIYDPMCSWCWGFRPVWEVLQEQLVDRLPVQYVLGGLAPDSNQPMSQETRDYVQSNWRHIQEVIPATEFNYDFWTRCQPRRSTYPACRAVIAAKLQDAAHEQTMIKNIQQAYYLEAKNPSDESTLLQLAERMGLNLDSFKEDLNAPSTQLLLEKDLQLYQQLARVSGASGFPSLVLRTRHFCHMVPRNYTEVDPTLRFIDQCMA